MIELLQILIKDTIPHISQNNSPWSGNFWLWIAAAEFFIILFLLLKIFKKKKTVVDPEISEILSVAKNSDMDMNSLMDNINKSRGLYKQLSTKCHPDRFADTEISNKANEIFQEITKNKRDYKRLLELKIIAETELNITI